MVVIQHFLLLNPLFTDESTGTILFFNLLLLAYLLPALAAGGVALFARGRRPQWYVALLAVLASLLAFAYATLSLRRLFQGEFIGAVARFRPGRDLCLFGAVAGARGGAARRRRCS